jgi:tripartite-type tricarboxylate transporter receptor subunit TctC
MKQKVAGLLHSVLVGAVLGVSTMAAQAQEFPAKPIRVVIMASPGSSGDVVTRIIAPEMAKTLGQPLVLENMLGAGGLVAHRYVAKQAAPDGYTIVSSASTVLTAHVFMKDVGLDFSRDLAPITIMAEGPLVLMTPAAAPWTDFNQMVAYAKANPGKLNTGVPSLQDATYLFLQAIRQKFGLSFVDVPYKGAAAAYSQAIMVNEVQLALGGEATAKPGLANGKTRVIAVSGNKRARSMPEVPTLVELGVTGADSTLLSLSAPAATPAAVLDKLNVAAVRALQIPDIRERIAKSSGFEVVASTRDEFAKILAARLQRYSEIAQSAGIRPE